MDMTMHQERKLPSISLSELDLPEVRVWAINGRYYVVAEVEMTGKENTEWIESGDASDKNKVVGTFRIKSVKAVGDKGVKMKDLESESREREYTDLMSKRT